MSITPSLCNNKISKDIKDAHSQKQKKGEKHKKQEQSLFCPLNFSLGSYFPPKLLLGSINPP
jgi:hypothetical protein